MVEEESGVGALASYSPEPGASKNSGAEGQPGRLFCWQVLVPAIQGYLAHKKLSPL